MAQASNQKRVEAIVVRPFAGADNIVRNVGQRFFTTEGRLKKYEGMLDARGRSRPLAVHYDPGNGQEIQEGESVETKAVSEAPENKAAPIYDNKSAAGKPKKRRGRPKGSRNKRRKKR